LADGAVAVDAATEQGPTAFDKLTVEQVAEQQRTLRPVLASQLGLSPEPYSQTLDALSLKVLTPVVSRDELSSVSVIRGFRGNLQASAWLDTLTGAVGQGRVVTLDESNRIVSADPLVPTSATTVLVAHNGYVIQAVPSPTTSAEQAFSAVKSVAGEIDQTNIAGVALEKFDAPRLLLNDPQPTYVGPLFASVLMVGAFSVAVGARRIRERRNESGGFAHINARLDLGRGFGDWLGYEVGDEAPVPDRYV
jgi:hypothetical protein